MCKVGCNSGREESSSIPVKLICRGVVHTKSNGGGVVPTRRSLDALQTNSRREAFVLDGSMKQKLKNELTSPRILWWICIERRIILDRRASA